MCNLKAKGGEKPHGKYKPVKWFYRNEYRLKTGDVVEDDTLWPICNDPSAELQSQLPDGEGVQNKRPVQWHKTCFSFVDLGDGYVPEG